MVRNVFEVSGDIDAQWTAGSTRSMMSTIINCNDSCHYVFCARVLGSHQHLSL